ncbi:MAG: hypothetical protein RLW61_04165 [Gammaproteobacteria bacterium]
MLQSVSGSPDWLIGIDDTDNLDTRGTGYRARCLVRALEADGMAEALGVTRHQLLLDDRIPYTSHNSSACLQVRSTQAADSLYAFCRDFMVAEAARGADVGLCLATPAQAAMVVPFGHAAKHEVLDQARAQACAQAAGIRLGGLTGTRDGVIGALAGVGLFAEGNDGRYIWKRRLREMSDATVSVGEILRATAVDDVREMDGGSLADTPATLVALGPWPRPVRVDGLSVLFVERGPAHESAAYHCIDKQRLKAFRP